MHWAQHPVRGGEGIVWFNLKGFSGQLLPHLVFNNGQKCLQHVDKVVLILSVTFIDILGESKRFGVAAQRQYSHRCVRGWNGPLACLSNDPASPVYLHQILPLMTYRHKLEKMSRNPQMLHSRTDTSFKWQFFFHSSFISFFDTKHFVLVHVVETKKHFPVFLASHLLRHQLSLAATLADGWRHSLTFNLSAVTPTRTKSRIPAKQRFMCNVFKSNYTYCYVQLYVCKKILMHISRLHSQQQENLSWLHRFLVNFKTWQSVSCKCIWWINGNCIKRQLTYIKIL